MPGPAPKPASTRARRNKTSTASVLRAQPGLIAPILPDVDWHPLTLMWWQDLWSSPMAPEYDSTDRHGLFKLAVLQNDFWSAKSPSMRIALSEEIRMQEQRFGLSPIDRRRLQWEIERTEEAVDRGATRRGRQGVVQPTAGKDPRSILRVV